MVFGIGHRSCLGRKFALVELVALLSTLLKETRVELVLEEGEDWNGARARAMLSIDQRTTKIAMRMLNEVKVRFVQRA